MNIDEAYRFVQFVSNKEQRGNVTPSQFNLAAKSASLEYYDDLFGGVKKILTPAGLTFRTSYLLSLTR